jgi:D123
MSSTFTTWPTLTKKDVIAFQFSSWYPTFSSLSIKSTVLPLADDFKAYLEADGVFVPVGSENLCVHPNPWPSYHSESKNFPRPLSEQVDHDTDDDEAAMNPTVTRPYTFPQLDARIRGSIDEYGAVFPKLNFSSPKARLFFLPPSSKKKKHNN